MKEMQQIRDSLKNLPKYSLSKEQQDRILAQIQERRRLKKRPLKPVAASLAFVIIFTILAVGQMDNSSSELAGQESARSIESTADQADKTLEMNMVSEGKSFLAEDVDQEVIGIEGKVGILNTFDHFVAEDTRRTAKLMVYFWGKPEDLVGKEYRIEAANESEAIIMSTGQLDSGLYSEDAHTLTSFAPFSKEGTWKLSFYVEDRLHEEFTLEVLPAFPATENYTLMTSPKEMKIGKETDMTIESLGKDKKRISVQLLNRKGEAVGDYTFIQEAAQMDAATNRSIFLYDGKLEFPEKGEWVLRIDGETTGRFEN